MHYKFATLAAIAGLLIASQASGAGRTKLRDICHVKGQEENTLRGLGLVVGLNGTGEAGDLQTMRALSSAMEIMGSPVSSTGRSDAKSLEDLKKIKNVALVWVTATVPGTGARRGDKIDCYVSAVNGKSLEGGMLAFSSLMGPDTRDRHVLALCHGQVVVDDATRPTVARVHAGCQMQEDVITPFFSKDGYVTLVLDHNHADFVVADSIGAQIEEIIKYSISLDDSERTQEELMAEYIQVQSAGVVRVKIPQQYRNYPVRFVAQLMEVRVASPDPEARVVINPRAGVITISGDVEIGDVLVSHRNLTVEARSPLNAELVAIDQTTSNGAKLDQLILALGDLKVPADDIIEIIRNIERSGKLHGKLVIE